MATKAWISFPSFFTTIPTTTHEDDGVTSPVQQVDERDLAYTVIARGEMQDWLHPTLATAAAKRVQFEWRRKKREHAAIKIQRATRSAAWDAWQHWETPLTTMPALVLERVAPSNKQLVWSERGPGPVPRNLPVRVVFLVATALLIATGLVVLADTATFPDEIIARHPKVHHPLAAAAGRTPSSRNIPWPPAASPKTPLKTAQPNKIAQQSRVPSAAEVQHPEGATASLLPGWMGVGNATVHADQNPRREANGSPQEAPADFWFSQRPLPFGGAIGTPSNAEVVRPLMFVPVIENVSAAIGHAVSDLVTHLKIIFNQLFAQGGRLKQRVVSFLAARPRART